METTSSLQAKLEELFEALPMERAMPSLRPMGPAVVDVNLDALGVEPAILAGLWLYVDDLERSHEISQNLTTPTGSYWHAIMHRREGDFWNAKYWFRRVGDHPVIAELGYDPARFVDECEGDAGRDQARYIEGQRREWKALFDWCILNGGRS